MTKKQKEIKKYPYHDWVQVEAGGVFPNSWSFKRCRRCGAVVTHYYQRESFSEALEREGLSEFYEEKTN